MKRPARAWSLLLHLALLAWLVLACLPIVWTAVISLRQYVDAFSVPVKWLAPVTFENYSRLWIDKAFYRNFLNTAVVTVGTVSVSLTVGCLAGYALSRYRGAVGFWLLITALVFRSLPHSTLLPSFYVMFDALGVRNEYFTLILVLVAINQPFTIWMLRSFFVNIPQELDEAAMVDGCTRFQAFRRVIIPVMWPGVVTTGLFSFLLGNFTGFFPFMVFGHYFETCSRISDYLLNCRIVVAIGQLSVIKFKLKVKNTFVLMAQQIEDFGTVV